MIDELGLAHANAVIDIAVINGCLHGFEIKSGQDTLARLSKQLVHYEDCLQELTIVCDERHERAVVKIAPDWVGIVVAKKTACGAIEFSTLKKNRMNPFVRADRLAHLLWRTEAVELLTKLGAPGKVLRKPRKELYQTLAERMTIQQIVASIRDFMVARQTWRRHPIHALYGD